MGEVVTVSLMGALYRIFGVDFTFLSEDGDKLQNILPETYEDNSDVCSDYMEKGRARIYEGSPLYAAALEIAQKG